MLTVRILTVMPISDTLIHSTLLDNVQVNSARLLDPNVTTDRSNLLRMQLANSRVETSEPLSDI